MSCKACDSIPPVVTGKYDHKGKYEDLGEFKTYIISPDPEPKTGLVVLYDVFGFTPQALQGADILATTVPGQLVVMPDFQKGEALDHKKFPPQNDEDKKALGQFLGDDGPGSIPNNTNAIVKLTKTLKEKYSSIKKWGIVGFCNGGKIATRVAISSDFFSSSAQCHPREPDFNDIEKLKIPHCMLASKDEDKTSVGKCAEELARKADKSRATIYGESHHGWMAARANLENEDERATYEQGYRELVDFFAATMRV